MNANGSAAKSDTVFLVVLALCAFAIRLAIIFGYVGADYQPKTDARDYSNIAWRLVTTGTYTDDRGRPTALRAPGWPLVLAGVYAVFGRDYNAARVLLAAIGTATCLAIFFLARRLFGALAARLAGALAVVYPQLFLWNAQLLSETLFVFVFVCALLVAYALDRRPSAWGAFALGLLVGWAVLIRAILLLFPIVLVGWYVWRFRKRLVPRTRWAQAACLAAGIVLPIAPWTIRNALVLHAFVPVSTIGGPTLWFSNNPRTFYEPEYWGGFTTWLDTPEIDRYAKLPEPACDAACKRRAIEWVLEQPFWAIARAATFKLLKFFDFYHAPSVHENLRFWLWLVPYFGALCGSIAAVWRFRSRTRELALLYLVVGYFLAMTVVFHGYTRMRAPLEPILIVLAAGFAADVYRQISQRRTRRLETSE